MPTIKQLPVASSVNDTDLIPVSQGGTTKGLLVGGLLSSTQPAISLAATKLLGRVSPTAGGPEPVSVGLGLAMTAGTMTATGADHLQFPASAALGAGDEVLVNSGGAAKRMAATALRGLFSAGGGIAIDGSGVISSPGSTTPATSSTAGAVKPGATLMVAADGTLDARVGLGSGTVAAGNDPRIVSAAPLALGDLRRYGWKGDGSDDTASFTAALAALPAVGGTVIVPFSPAGTMLGAVAVNKPVTIQGEGGPAGQTLLIPSNLAGTMFTVTAPFVTFSDLAIGPVNPGTTKATAGSYILVQPSAARFRAQRLTLNEFHEGITIAGNVASVELTNIRGFLYSTGLGQSSALLHLQGGYDVRVDNLTANGPGTGTADVKAGIWVENLGDATISNSDVIAMGTDLLVTPGSGQVVASLWVVDTFLDTASRGAWFAPTGTGVIVRSRLSNVWASSHSNEGIRIEGVDGLDIDGPHVFLNSGNGIALLGGTNIRVSGGQVAQNGDNGVYVAAGVSDWSVVNTTLGTTAALSGNHSYGVYVAAGASDRYRISGNNVVGNGQGAVQDSGTGTHKLVWANLGDAQDYTASRDAATGFLRFTGRQAGYSGYIFATDDGAERFRIDSGGGLMGSNRVLTTATGQPLGSANQSVRVVTAAGGVSLATTDAVVVVRKAAGAATSVMLESGPAAGRVVVVKDGRGDAGTNPITIAPPSGTIDGAASYALSAGYASVTLIYTGTEWSVL